MNKNTINSLYNSLPKDTRDFVDLSIERIIKAKKSNGKVVVVTGSGPNIHEGVTTLIAELITKGIIDGVTTSSAVVAHEMAGTLDKVLRVDGIKQGFDEDDLPRGNIYEYSMLSDDMMESIYEEMGVDLDSAQLEELDGDVIIKAAGNMGFPLGLRTETLAKELLFLCKSQGLSFEELAGKGADPKTMLGAAYEKKIPCLVTVPQLIGGGMVGVCVGDSISILERTTRIAKMLGSADVIIESAVALTQEIHDGPFETYTGHGIWASDDGYYTYSLKGKTLIRIDLDPNLKKAWEFERQSSKVQEAIDKGLPKTKMMDIPFRMEMSGFARLEDSIPVVGDIGAIWPVIASRVAEALNIALDFISYPQNTPEGQEMREWIVDNVKPVNSSLIYK
jgi:hypothetical protein